MAAYIPEVVEDIRKFVEEAYLEIRMRFEDGHPLARLWFHDTEHTFGSGVIERATRIAVVMELPKRSIMIAQYAAAYHDTVQSWSVINGKGGVMKRQLHAGVNEVGSAHKALARIDSSSLPFSPFEKGLIASAIITTIPEWNVEHRTAFQPLLTPDSHPVIRAVALADLGAAGMDPVAFSRGGTRLFAEEQLDVMFAVRNAKVPSEIGQAKQRQYRERLIGWLETQPRFALGRKALLEEELSLRKFPKDVQGKLLGLFGSFDESARLAEKDVEAAKAMDFVTLMRSVWEDAFPGF